MSGTIAVPGTSDVAITFCAETDITSAGARIFVQALLDDTPTNPSSVVFAQLTQEGNPGTRCFTFISNSVPAGVHTVLIQALI